MNECIFCKIVSGQIPSETVHEDDEVLVFLDIKAIAPGHILVIPKTHADDFSSASRESITASMLIAQRMGRALMQALGAGGFTIGVNNGRAAGQLVDHLHVHVIPRFEGDGLEHWPGKTYQDGEMAKIGQKLREALR